MSSVGKEIRPPRRDEPAAPAAKPSRPAKVRDPSSGPPTWARVLGSMLLVWHLVWVVLCPMANSAKTNPSIHQVVSHWLPRLYTDPLYLNVGYGFFSPDPPFASPIIQYKVYGEDGRVIAEGKLPDSERLSPRLRYHRHKMLADQGTDTMIDEERPNYVLRCYARHLIRVHNGARAEVSEVAHEILPLDVWQGDPGTTEPGPNGEPPRPERKPVPLDDPSTYRTIRTEIQTRGDVESIDARRKAPEPAAEVVPTGGVQ